MNSGKYFDYKTIARHAVSPMGDPELKFQAAMMMHEYEKNGYFGTLADALMMEGVNVTDIRLLQANRAMWLVESATNATAPVPFAQYMVGAALHNGKDKHVETALKIKGHENIQSEEFILRAALAPEPVVEACKLVHKAMSGPYNVKAAGYTDVMEKKFNINFERDNAGKLFKEYMKKLSGIAEIPLSRMHYNLIGRAREKAGITRQQTSCTEKFSSTGTSIVRPSQDVMPCSLNDHCKALVCSVSSDGDFISKGIGPEQVKRMSASQLEKYLQMKRAEQMTRAIDELCEHGIGGWVNGRNCRPN